MSKLDSSDMPSDPAGEHNKHIFESLRNLLQMLLGKKTLLIAIVIFLLMAGGVGGYFWFSNDSNVADGSVSKDEVKLANREEADRYAATELTNDFDNFTKASHHYETAERYYIAEDYDKALEYYLKSFELDQTIQAVYDRIIELYQKQSNATKAKEYSDLYIKYLQTKIDTLKGFDQAYQHYLIGFQQDRAGYTDQAKQSFTRSLELFKQEDQTNAEVKAYVEDLTKRLEQ